MNRRIVRPAPRLMELVQHRWSIPLLAVLAAGTTGVPGLQGGGAKFVTLSRRLGAGADALSRTLAALAAQGWVRRNPGYGHPLRPEWVLAERGLALARACGGVMDVVEDLAVAETALRKWSLPVTLTLGGDERRFGDLKACLPGVTPRALALALKDLEREGLVERVVVAAYPPRPSYDLSAAGRRVHERVRTVNDILAA